jgi:cell shape-determining protein MreC
MLSLLPPLAVIVGALAWAGFTFQQHSATKAEIARLRQVAEDLPGLRARHADLRELETLPQEIERLKRENARLPEAQAELQNLAAQKAALQKDLVDKKNSAQQQKLSELLNQNRALSEGLPVETPAAPPVAVPPGL